MESKKIVHCWLTGSCIIHNLPNGEKIVDNNKNISWHILLKEDGEQEYIARVEGDLPYWQFLLIGHNRKRINIYCKIRGMFKLFKDMLKAKYCE